MKRKIDDLGRIVLPAEMKKEIGLVNGLEANIEVEDHKIIITKPGSIDYKNRNEKALEYIETYKSGFKNCLLSDVEFNVLELEEILKGGNNE